MTQNFHLSATIHYGKVKLVDTELLFVCSNKFKDVMLSLSSKEFEANLNKYHAKLRYGRVRGKTSKIYKISKEMLKLNFNEQQIAEESARSELCDALRVDQLVPKFDKLLYIEDSEIYSTAPKFNNINKILSQLLDKPKHENLSINQMKFLNKLFNKNSNHMYQFCYLFGISYSNYYRNKRITFSNIIEICMKNKKMRLLIVLRNI